MGVKGKVFATDPAGITMLGVGSDGRLYPIGVDSVTGEMLSRSVDRAGQYETVAAWQTAQVLGGAGAIGDQIDEILVIPATTSPGNILLLDGETSITVFTGGATSIADLKPFTIQLGLKSVNGPWKMTTGANVACVASGSFSA